MTGRLVHRASRPHVCQPGIVTVPGCWPPHFPGQQVADHTACDQADFLHDRSFDYDDGDVWECDDCGRRWRLRWPGRVESYDRRSRRGCVRLLPCSGDWVAENRWQRWRRERKAGRPAVVGWPQSGVEKLPADIDAMVGEPAGDFVYPPEGFRQAGEPGL